MKKFIAGLFLSTSLLIAATGCSGEASQNENILIMGTNAAFPPFEYIQGTEVVGFDVDLAKLIADQLDMELQIMDMEFNTLTGAVSNGIIDIAVAGMTNTPERRESVNFSDGYFSSKQMIIVKNDSSIESTEDLAGQSIGVQLGTTGDQFISSFAKDGTLQNAEIIRFDKGALAIADLLNDTVDAVIIDEEPAKNFVAAQDNLQILEAPFIEEEYAIAIAKDNTELTDQINSALASIKASGQYDEIFNKYFESAE
ncbi:MAG: hypothetical protein ATN31_08385 [Candidatus Epulonipiscioides saccharophilum]|nr:MAG: hypothetical protein ATN31_08385 [Epulopiscium sp. AS2M-Bin001]